MQFPINTIIVNLLHKLIHFKTNFNVVLNFPLATAGAEACKLNILKIAHFFDLFKYTNHNRVN